MHERNLSIAAKGKAKESSHWQLGWWDLIHLLEGTRRPVQWSKSSVLFTTHESEPFILGRHFPSSRQFVLPPFHYSLPSYEPATVLALSPADDWLFAYFPGKGNDGVGCAWHKEAQLDRWTLNECWTYPIGGGVTTAAWTQSTREWTVSDAGASSRLPPRGPLSTDGSPMLLLVTEAHILHVHALTPQGKIEPPHRASLLQPVNPAIPTTDPNIFGKLGGNRVCVKAAVGMHYQDATVLVAMRSQLLPSQSSNQAAWSPMDHGIPMEISSSSSESPTEWELWGEEHIISMCEVRIDTRKGVSVMTHPLPSIPHTHPRLADLIFHAPPYSSSLSSPVGGAKHENKEPRTMHLIATFFDPEDYSTLPKSDLMCYTFRVGVATNAYWAFSGECRRPCQTKIPAFVFSSLIRGSIAVGFLDAGGLLPRKKSKTAETAIGTIEVLKLPDLSTHDNWESVPIHSHVQAGMIDVPASISLSPNEALLCCMSSPLLGSHVSIQPLPRRVFGDSASTTGGHFPEDLAKLLVTAIRSRRSPSDVIHALEMPALPTEVTATALFQSLAIMEKQSFGLPEMWTAELIGIAAEVYSARTQRLERCAERDLCASRWQVAQDIASMSACCAAFEACREGTVYDLDAVWQLLGLACWTIEFVERLFKECVFIGDRSDPGPTTPKENGSTPLTNSGLDNPIFLHLVHPFALAQLHSAAEHVKRFSDQLSRLPAKGDSARIAKDVLMDATEGSGVDLALLGPLLAEVLQDCKKLDAQDLRRSLAFCCPVPALKPHVRKAVDRIVASKAVDRAKLFVKPADLADGLTRLALTERLAGTGSLQPNTKTDVVRKGVPWRMPHASLCLRCGGRTDVVDTHKVGYVSPMGRWQTWEKSWQVRCVCGGTWSSSGM